MDDLDSQNISYFGNEMEVRIYEENIPLNKYITSLELCEMYEDNPLYNEIAEECKKKNVKCIENAF